jgi:Holliday junction resolvase RusA-like endonuclease
MVLNFTVNTRPVAQSRPRFKIVSKGLQLKGLVYDTKQCKAFKELIAWKAKMEALKSGITKPVNSPVSLTVKFYMGIAKKGYHVSRPDLDNLIKAVKDALTGVIWQDDRQVFKIHAEKTYGPPSISIKIHLIKS